MSDPVEVAAKAFVKFNADNEWSLSQVQGFRYGQDHVVRDCMLPGDRQEIWRRPVSDTSPEDMRDFIDLYCAQQAMGAAILAFLNACESEAGVEKVARALCSNWAGGRDDKDWSGLSENSRANARSDARAVLRSLADLAGGGK
jgi:hypothetical protein